MKDDRKDEDEQISGIEKSPSITKHLVERNQGALIGLIGSIFAACGSVLAACVVVGGAYRAAGVFEPDFVSLEGVVFNTAHVVSVVDTPNGCSIIMSNGSNMDPMNDSRFSIDLMGCYSLRRALEPRTVTGRVTQGEMFFSGLAQSSFFTTTGTCPEEMRLVRHEGEAVHISFPNGETLPMCRLSADVARRLGAGPPWPESWKLSGLAVSFSPGTICPEELSFHADFGDVRLCCFGGDAADPHPGHISDRVP